MITLTKLRNFYEYIANESSAKTSREKLQLIHSLVVTSIGIVLSLFFIGFNFVDKNLSNIIYVGAFLASLIAIFILIKNKINLEFVYNFLNLSFITLLILVTQNQDVSGILWAYIYPVSAIFLFGTKQGIFWSFVMFISVLISFYVSDRNENLYSLGFMLRFIATYLVITTISAWFNYYKELYYVELENTNKKLELEHMNLQREITERKALEKKLTQMAHTDDLTNLLNRRYFWELGNKEIMRSKRYDVPMCLAVLDIDHFKTINDTFGHPIGDEILRVLSRHCSYVLRESDILGRIGGDEFAFVLVHVTPKEAYDKFEALREEIASLELKSLQGKEKLTISIGIASLSEDVTKLGELYKRADKALYEAKAKGRNIVTLI